MSDARFRTLHALRIKGFAKTDVVAELAGLDGLALAETGAVLLRLSAYCSRLAETCRKLVPGETTMLTGVMCGSYQDVRMELREDLFPNEGIDRVEEGSI